MFIVEEVYNVITEGRDKNCMKTINLKTLTEESL
jgi:hypothetical protein